MNAWASLLTLLGGLMGAAGVAAAAAAAHGKGGSDLAIAANFLLFHAGPVAALALFGWSDGLILTSASILAGGTLLFSGDLAARALAGSSLAPMAAPSGGILMILGWLCLAAAGARALVRG